MERLCLDQVRIGLDLLELRYCNEAGDLVLAFGGPAGFVVRISVADDTLRLRAVGTETFVPEVFAELLTDLNQVSITCFGPQSGLVMTGNEIQSRLSVGFDQRIPLPIAPTVVVTALVDNFFQEVNTCLMALVALRAARREAVAGIEAIEVFLQNIAAGPTDLP